MLVLFVHGMGGKNSLAFTEHSAKNTSKSQLLQIQRAEKAAPQMKIITAV